MLSIYSAVRELFVNIETITQSKSSYVEEWATITLVYIDDRRNKRRLFIKQDERKRKFASVKLLNRDVAR